MLFYVMLLQLMILIMKMIKEMFIQDYILVKLNTPILKIELFMLYNQLILHKIIDFFTTK